VFKRVYYKLEVKGRLYKKVDMLHFRCLNLLIKLVQKGISWGS